MKKVYLIVCLIIMGISIQISAQTDPGMANLTHKWTFDNGTADDMVGTVNGTLVGEATITNNALNTSAGGHVELDGAALAVGTYSQLSVEAWFTSSAAANDGYHFLYFFGNSDGEGRNFVGYTPARGNNVSKPMIKTGGEERGVHATELDDAVMHHMVCVIDETTLSYYLDGNLMNTVLTDNSNLSEVGDQLAYFCKGGYVNDPTWKGEIHEISMYNTALTKDNVKYLYNMNAVMIEAIDPGTTNLTHQWTFDDGTATDLVGNIGVTLMGTATLADKALHSNDAGYAELDATELAINTYSALTVETWFTSTAGVNNGFHFLYYFGNSDGNGNHFTGFTPARAGSPTDCSRLMLDSGEGEKAVNGAEFNNGILRHVVGVIDATTISYYLDGNLMGTASIEASLLANVGTQFAWFFKGGWPDAAWQGTLNKFSIYDAALTANNVKHLYSLGAEDGSTDVKQVTKENHKVYLSNNQIVVDFESTNAASAQIEVYNVNGSLVSTEAFVANPGLNHKTFSVNYPRGIYIVRLNVGGQTSSTKVVR